MITLLFLFTKPAQIFLGLCRYCIYTSRYFEIKTEYVCIKERFQIVALSTEQILGTSGNCVNIIWYILSMLSVWVKWLSGNLAIIGDVDTLYLYNIFPFCHVLTLTETIKKILNKKIIFLRNRLALCMSV